MDDRWRDRLADGAPRASSRPGRMIARFLHGFNLARFAAKFMHRRMFTPPSTLPDDPATLQLILRAALAEIERLQLQLAGLRRNRFGRRSEQLDDATLQQGEEDFEQSVAEQQAGLDAVLPPVDAPSAEPMPLLPIRLAPNRRSAIAARCRRTCRESRSSWTSMTRPARVAVAHCMSSAKTAPRCWIMCRLNSRCG